MDIYREEVLDHYDHPRNTGELSGPDVLSAHDVNASCGDRAAFYLRVKDGKIVEVKWSGEGCAIMTASSSKLSLYLLGKTLKDLAGMSDEELASAGAGFEVNPGRIKCLTLPAKVVKSLVSGR